MLDVRKVLRPLCALALIAATLVVAADLALADPLRTTQVAIGTTSPETPLQTVFDARMVDPWNVATEQSATALWNVNAFQTPAASIIIEIAGYSGSNTVGLYNGALDTVQLFTGADGAGTDITIEFNAAGTQVRIGGGAFADFDSASGFGFYLDPQGPGTGQGAFYTEDFRNANGAAQALVFQGQGGGQRLTVGGTDYLLGSGDYAIAFEDLVYASGDKDFNDMVFLVRTVPIPEPASIVLLGLGSACLGIGASRRRRRAA